MDKIELVKTKKDHYILQINGKDITGEKERSYFRNLIEKIDNNI